MVVANHSQVPRRITAAETFAAGPTVTTSKYKSKSLQANFWNSSSFLLADPVQRVVCPVSTGFRLDAEAARYSQGAHLIPHDVNFQSSDLRAKKASKGAKIAVKR